MAIIQFKSHQDINQFYKIENRDVRAGGMTTVTTSIPHGVKVGDELVIPYNGQTYEFEVVEVLEEAGHLKRKTKDCIRNKSRVKRF